MMIRWCVIGLMLVAVAKAGDYVPKPNEYPPLDAGVYLSGELVVVDPINRRGGIRLDCKGNEQLAQNGPLHYFAMLPCGEIWLHGAPATLQDVPLGTHVQGYFYVPPAGEEATIAPPPAALAVLIPKQNHALLLEDDLSFHHRQGQSWKIVSIALDAGKVKIESVGKTATHGLSGAQTLDFDIGTRVWKNGRPVEMNDVKPGAIVQLNLGRAINWRDGEFGLNDLWLDAESQAQATELQRRRNVRYHHIRWLPGRIETAEPNDFGGGLITISIFGGVAQQLLDELEANKDERVAVAAAENTVRTWVQRSDRVFGKITRFEKIPNPSPGFSGVRLHMKFAELIDHFRPGNAVRVKAEDWIWISNTPEERIKSFEDREQSRTLRLPQQSVPAENAR